MSGGRGWKMAARAGCAGLCALLLLCAAVPGAASAQEAEPLGRLELAHALELAERHWLRQEEFALSSAYHEQNRREHWRRRWLPSLRLQGTRRQGDLSSTTPQEELEARLDYLLYDGGAVSAAHEAARRAGQADAFAREEALVTLRLDVAEAYLALAASERRMDSQGLAVEQARRQYENTRRREELGLRSGLEVMQARVALADEEQTLADERRTHTEHRLELAQLLGVPVQEEASLALPLPEVPALPELDGLQAEALEEAPAVRRQAAELARSRQQVREQEAGRYPELSLSSSVVQADEDRLTRSVGLSLVYRFGGHRADAEGTRSRVTAEEERVTLQGAEVVETTETVEREQETSRFGVTFFDFSDPTASAASRLLNARLEYARSARTLAEARNERERTVQARYHDVQAARDTLALERLRLEKDELEVQSYGRAYEAGNVPLEELLEQRTERNRTRLSVIAAEAELRRAYLQLLAAAGRPWPLEGS